MKKAFLILLCVLIFGPVFAQEQDSGRGFRAGVNAYGGWNLPVRVTTKYITEETGPWHGNQTWTGGICLSWIVAGQYRIEIAPRYSWHKTGFELSPPLYDEKTIYTETFELITIPLTFKRYLDNFFFISTGTIVDFPFRGKPEWIDPQSGFGLSLGAGKEFHIRNLAIDVSPFAELHSVVPFTHEDNQQRLLIGALRIGISYIWNRSGNTVRVDDKLNHTVVPEK